MSHMVPSQRMTRTERNHAISALRAWFASQDISPTNAAFLMATLIGRIVAADIKTPKSRVVGLGLLLQEMTSAAEL